MPGFADLAALARRVERWMLPAACLTCGAPQPEAGPEPLACDVCRARWRRLPGPACERCGQPLEAELPCRLCPTLAPALGRVRSAVWFDGGARQAVHALKYGGWWRVAEALARAMAPLVPSADSVTFIPVPLGRRRRALRGYNQAEVLARALAAGMRHRVRADLLRRGRETRAQATLAAVRRAANVAGAFVVVGPVPARCILVDDVLTTGATLGACAEALAAAGAVRVEAITFARARGPVPALEELPWL